MDAFIDNRQWLYRRHPEGLVGPEHYELVTTPLATDRKSTRLNSSHVD